MKKLTFIISLIFFFTNEGFSQIQAVTDKGDQVTLYEDGTWKYNIDSSETEEKEIPVSNIAYSKNEKSSFEVKSTKVNAGVYINTKDWTYKKNPIADAQEYTFQSRGKDIYAMMITEKVDIPIENLKKLALSNARDAAPDTKIVTEEYRMVNGKKIFFMQMNGSIEGMKFTYLGYYYSSEGGTIQFISYTTQNLLEEYKNDMFELLNGFTIH
jgi:hypothetical protein